MDVFEIKPVCDNGDYGKYAYPDRVSNEDLVRSKLLFYRFLSYKYFQ